MWSRLYFICCGWILAFDPRYESRMPVAVSTPTGLSLTPHFGVQFVYPVCYFSCCQHLNQSPQQPSIRARRPGFFRRFLSSKMSRLCHGCHAVDAHVHAFSIWQNRRIQPLLFSIRSISFVRLFASPTSFDFCGNDYISSSCSMCNRSERKKLRWRRETRSFERKERASSSR